MRGASCAPRPSAFCRAHCRKTDLPLVLVRSTGGPRLKTLSAHAPVRTAPGQVSAQLQPRFNPDEMLNADLKQVVTKLAPAQPKLQLFRATSRHLRSVQRQPARVRKYFEHEPIRYAL